MARRVLLAQHKPYSFLSPSVNPVGRKRFALELLTLNNQSHNGLPWAAAAQPCDVPGMLCAGRLDADSTGLMLWTNDHALCESVIGPRSLVEKECARLRLDVAATMSSRTSLVSHRDLTCCRHGDQLDFGPRHRSGPREWPRGMVCRTEGGVSPMAFSRHRTGWKSAEASSGGMASRECVAHDPQPGQIPTGACGNRFTR